MSTEQPLQGGWKNIIGLLVVLGALALVARYADIETLRGYIESAGIWAPLLLILAKSLTIIIAPIGGSPLYPIAGALFGFWEGGALLVAGDALGGAVSFMLSRRFGRKFAQKMLGSEDGLLARSLTLMSTPKGYLLARACFLTFPELACWGAGLTTLRFLPFITIYTAVGIAPTFLLAGLGALIAETNNSVLIPLVAVGTMVLSATLLGVFATVLRKKYKL